MKRQRVLDVSWRIARHVLVFLVCVSIAFELPEYWISFQELMAAIYDLLKEPLFRAATMILVVVSAIAFSLWDHSR